MTTLPRVTVASVPRERFAVAERSIESLLAHTRAPYRLLSVDGGSPSRFAAALADLAATHGFELLRTACYLTPNQARNLALTRIDTEFVAFVDNDVVVRPGWLEAMIACADDTGAAVVTPLTCQGPRVHHEIHCAGGEVEVEEGGRESAKRLVEVMHRQGEPLEGALPRLERGATGLAEFHAVLVRRSLFDELGPLDEGLLNTKEHLDFSLAVRARGHEIWFEPASVVTYLLGVPLATDELPYFMLRWSDAWERRSLAHLRRKHRLARDRYFWRRALNRGWRRRKAIVQPLLAAYGVRRSNLPLKALLYLADRVLNPLVVRRYGPPAGAGGLPVEVVQRCERTLGGAAGGSPGGPADAAQPPA